MTPQPHPLRCETCDHYNGGHYFDKCKNEIFPDNMDSTERQYIKDWISSHGCASHSAAPRPAPSPVYQYRVSVPSKAFPSIIRKRLAINDIGAGTDEFTRIDFELQDGDIIQVIRSTGGEPR